MTKKKQVDWRIVCTGLVCLTLLEGFALLAGRNGTILALVVGIIAATIGIAIPTDIIKRK